MYIQDVGSHVSPQLPFSLLYVNCQDFLGMIVEGFPAAFSIVWNSELFLDLPPSKAREARQPCYLIYTKGEKKWIHTFSKGIDINEVQENKPIPLYMQITIILCFTYKFTKYEMKNKTTKIVKMWNN